MRTLKTFAVLAIAVFAVSVVGAASASAAPKFTATLAGAIGGTQTSSQVFTTSEKGSENVTCKKAHTSGTAALEAASQKVTVEYSECTAATIIGGIAATISKAEYSLAASGSATILNTITIHVGGLANCNTVVGPQGPLSSVSYTNVTPKIEESSAVKGIVSTSTGLCPHGTNGTYTGSNLVESLVTGGTLKFDKE
jgi:hypothetical protein